MSSNITRGSFPAASSNHQEQGLSHFHGFSSARTISGSSCSNPQQETLPPPAKKKRSLPGTPDPTAEVIALSPKTLLATNRFVCEVCNKGFQRDQNLQLHRRGHNLPWKLKQKNRDEIRKKVYICPEPSCVHHNPARALGDLTGIKKHYCRKHGEKKWKCEKCSKKYAVQADWKAHSKICGTREYKCDCGTIFSRRDSFVTHRAFCDVLAEENNKAMSQGFMANIGSSIQGQIPQFLPSLHVNSNTISSQIQISNHFNHPSDHKPQLSLPQELMSSMPPKHLSTTLFPKEFSPSSSNSFQENHSLAQLSATSLLERAAQLGAIASSNNNNNTIISPMMQNNFVTNVATSTLGGTILQSTCFENQGQVMGLSSGSTTQFKGAQEISSQLFANGRADHQNPEIDDAMLKNLEKEQEEAKFRFNGVQGFQLGNRSRGTGNFGSHGTEGMNMMTVDFLGIGGERRGNGLYGQGQQMLKMEFEGIGEAINGGLNHHLQ